MREPPKALGPIGSAGGGGLMWAAQQFHWEWPLWIVIAVAVAGGVCAIWTVIMAIEWSWHLFNDFREHHGRKRLTVSTSHVLVALVSGGFALLIAAVFVYLASGMGAVPAAANPNSQTLAWPNPYRPELVVGKYFKSQEVPLDGKAYSNCTFENVTFSYEGTTPVNFNNNTVIGPPQYKTNNPAVAGTLLLTKGFGLMKKEIADNLRVVVDNEVKNVPIESPIFEPQAPSGSKP